MGARQVPRSMEIRSTTTTAARKAGETVEANKVKTRQQLTWSVHRRSKPAAHPPSNEAAWLHLCAKEDDTNEKQC